MFLHLAEAVEAGFPDIYRIGNFVAIEWQLAFEAKRIAGTQATREYAEFLARGKNLVPHSCACFFVGGNVDFESVFGGVARPTHQDVREAAQFAPRHPVELYFAQISTGQLLQKIDRLRPLDRDLREVVGKILDLAIKLAGI